jgi:hypothetical protein
MISNHEVRQEGDTAFIVSEKVPPAWTRLDMQIHR